MSSEWGPPPTAGSAAANPPESAANNLPPPLEDLLPPPVADGAEVQASPVAEAVPVNVTPAQTGVAQPGGAVVAAARAPPPPARKVARKAAPAGEKGGAVDERVLIGVAAGAGLLILFMIGMICCACKKRRRKKKYEAQIQDHMQYFYANGGPNSNNQFYPNPASKQKWNSDQALHITIKPNSNTSSTLSSPQQGGPIGLNHGTFTYDDLAAATSGFSKGNLLGQGGFGYVHKGVLPNGQEVAVKSLKSGSGQGEREFQAEVEIISRVHHRHLVSLVGYCIAGGRRMLVYEFVPNNNLEFHLHGKSRPPLEWGKRLKIAKGSARGLAYLHEDCQPRIIHRDIKTANILIDYNFDAQVADFGLAKLTADNQTHVSTRIMGTFGYLAPEYACSGQLTEKSDVYSFGIMLLELITGRPPVDLTGEMEETLVDWARPLLLRALEDGNYDELIDPRLENNFDPREMRSMIACAAASVRHSARKRPKMSQIVRALEGDMSLEDLHNGVKPGQSTTFAKSVSGNNDTSYSAEMRKFMKLALDTSSDSGESK